MSIVQTVDGKMDSFWVDINGHPIPIDHIIQMSLYAGVGVLGEPGEIVITAQAFKLLDQAGPAYNPVGKPIEFIITDPKVGERPYVGVITSMVKNHDKKQDTVILGFDKPHWVKLHKIKYWKCYDHTTVLEVVKDFFESQGVPFNQYPENHSEFRGTHWENFCVPQNGPALGYLMEELTKDNFIYYTNPEDGGIVVINWSDLRRLDVVHSNYADYVSGENEILGNFDRVKTEWKDHTFTFAKQINSELPFKIQSVSNGFNPDISETSTHDCIFFTGLKKPLAYNIKEEKLEKNDIQLEQMEEYAGEAFDDITIDPYPSLMDLIDQDLRPKADYEDFNIESNRIIFPRYMAYRMQQSYATRIHLNTMSIVIPGSSKMVVPMTGIPISYYENARVDDPKELAIGDYSQSGLFLIWSSKLSIIGPNMLLSLTVVQPYTAPYGSAPEPEALEDPSTYNTGDVRPDELPGAPGTGPEATAMSPGSVGGTGGSTTPGDPCGNTVNGIMTTSQRGRELIAGFEAFRAEPYKDSGGIPTIGYGSTYYPDGTKVTMSDPPITQERAIEIKSVVLKKDFEPAVNSALSAEIKAGKVTQPMFDALVSLAYNAGGGAIKSSPMVKSIKAGDIQAAANAIPTWRATVNGQPSKGLSNRRLKEKEYFLLSEPICSDGEAGSVTGGTSLPSTIDAATTKYLESGANVVWGKSNKTGINTPYPFSSNKYPSVKQEQQNATERPEPITELLARTINSVLQPRGLTYHINSGGQSPAHRSSPYGSARHNYGNAADGDIKRNGDKLYWSKPNDLAILKEIVEEFANAGILGIGGHESYMGDGRLHVGFGKPATWGSNGGKGPAPAWMVEAHAKGLARFRARVGS